MTECLECSLTKMVLAQSWSQTVLAERLMEFQSSRDRSQSLCVLRRSGSEPETRCITGESGLPPKYQPPRGARRKCGDRPLSVAYECKGMQCANARPRLLKPGYPHVEHGVRGLSVDVVSLAGGRSPGDLRACRTGPAI